MTIEQLEAQDEVLRQAWKDGALNDAWYNNWIEKVYTEQGAKIISSNTVLADSKNLCGWVSVGERLPECGHYIATYFNPSDKSKKKYVVPIWRGRNGWYWDNAEKEKAEDKTLKVTHWMKFPEPSVGG